MKALGVFWLVILAAFSGAILALHQLGPPDEGIPPSLIRTATPAPSDRPAGSTPRLPPRPTEPAVPVPAPAAMAREEAPPPAALPPAEAPVTAAASLPEATALPSPPPAFAAVPAAVMAPAPSPPAALARPLPSAPEPPPLPAPSPRPEVLADRPIPPPDPALLEPSRHGLLPRIGEGGRSSIRAYGRPFDKAETRPKVSLVVGNLGLSLTLSEDAIRRLPSATGLAFSPYAPWPEPLLERARTRGMEVLSALPLEPANYPLNDPGDRALLTSLPQAENADRLAWVLTRITGQVGALGALGPMRGERFAALPETLGAVQDVMRQRGLLYIDPRPGAHSPARAWGRTVDVLVDEPATRGEIDRRLVELERIAREQGSALGLAADVSPVLVDRVAAWAAGLESRGLVMAPVTALIRRPEDLPRN